MSLAGRRIIVVEDDFLIAMLLEDMLADLGCVIVGLANTVGAALALMETAGEFDAAILDVNVAGQMVFPAADAARARGARTIFCTGYGDGALRPQDAGCQVLRKPFRQRDLTVALSTALGMSVDRNLKPGQEVGGPSFSDKA